ncbi:glutathione S-transferase family protein [Nannocystis punicea]|uniref:Glutathione S-transferase family protein n=1 Tax=Nannocystis punicea TaxID=2995304 RepID=A0ABY7HAG1_9BACT|nr:glutathione S-transferase family protein [Nannocystis poenicansa]WAS96233.1 glutathione S-transferase family protein [Nannocystis poenicansa]
MKIYWFEAQAPRRVVALAKHLGITAEFVQLDLMAGDLKTATYAGLNPNMKAPTLVDGELVLWESSAIMAYLCTQAGSDMWPAHAPAEQVEVLRWLSWNDSHWQDAVGPFYFEHIIKPKFGFGAPDRAALAEKVEGVVRLARVLDEHLQGRDFVACGRLTIADFQLASMATDWRETEMPLASFANVVRWLDGLNRVPAWAEPWPTAQTTRFAA